MTTGSTSLWLGCSATSGLHFDALDNVLCNAGPGEKLVHLYSPWLTRALAPRGREQLPIESAFHSVHRPRAAARPFCRPAWLPAEIE